MEDDVCHFRLLEQLAPFHLFANTKGEASRVKGLHVFLQLEYSSIARVSSLISAFILHFRILPN